VDDVLHFAWFTFHAQIKRGPSCGTSVVQEARASL
jgi:hypothetical protein